MNYTLNRFFLAGHIKCNTLSAGAKSYISRKHNLLLFVFMKGSHYLYRYEADHLFNGHINPAPELYALPGCSGQQYSISPSFYCHIQRK